MMTKEKREDVHVKDQSKQRKLPSLLEPTDSCGKSEIEKTEEIIKPADDGFYVELSKTFSEYDYQIKENKYIYNLIVGDGYIYRASILYPKNGC